MINTNISLNEMLWWVQYLEDAKMYTFGLNTSYSYDRFNVAQKGSFLYTPQRELFWGASVLLPMGASAWNLSHYDTIHQYTDFISHLQNFSIENAKIGVMPIEYIRCLGLSLMVVGAGLAVVSCVNYSVKAVKALKALSNEKAEEKK